MMNCATITVTLLFTILETECFSVQRNEDRRYNEINWDYNKESTGRKEQLFTKHRDFGNNLGNDLNDVIDSLEDKYNDKILDSKEKSKEQDINSNVRLEFGNSNKNVLKKINYYNPDSVIRGNLNWYSDSNEERDRDLSSEEIFKIPHSINISEKSIWDNIVNASGGEDHSSEERFRVLQPPNISKRNIVGKIFNDSSEDGHSSEEIFRLLYPVDISKRNIVGKIFNDSSEEDLSSEERFRTGYPLKLSIQSNVLDKNSKVSESNEIVQSSYSLQTSDSHVQPRDVNGFTHSHNKKPLKNLHEANIDYLDEVLYGHDSKEDKNIVSNIGEDTHSDENDNTEVTNDDYSDESIENNEVYEKYVDEIAKKYGYNSNEENDEDDNGDDDNDDNYDVGKDEDLGGGRDERDEDNNNNRDDDYSRPCGKGTVRDSSGKCRRRNEVGK